MIWVLGLCPSSQAGKATVRVRLAGWADPSGVSPLFAVDKTSCRSWPKGYRDSWRESDTVLRAPQIPYSR